MSIFGKPILTGVGKGSASGAVASFSDGAKGLPLRSLVANIEPVQDLHGFENPWPAGGGKNKFDVDKMVNTSDITISNGVITVTGNSKNSTKKLSELADLTVGEAYILTANTTGSENLIYLYGTGANVSWSFGTSKTITQEMLDALVFFYGGSGTTSQISNFMIRLSSVSDASFSPYSNICPISGRTSATVTRTGRNVLPYPFADGGRITKNGITFSVASDGIVEISGTATGVAYYDFVKSDNKILLKAGTYTKTIPKNENVQFNIYKNQGNPISSGNNATFTLSEDTEVFCYLRVSEGVSFDTALRVYPQIELGSTPTPYAPYSGNQYTLQLGQTIYGGTLDVTNGVLRVDRAMVDLGTLNYFKSSSTSAIGGSVFSVRVSNVGEGMATRNRYASNTMISSIFATAPSSVWWVNEIPDLSMSVNTNTLFVADSRYADAATFKAAMSGVQLVYELATPITIPLTPQEISTLQGQNNVWADTGDVDVEYLKQTLKYIGSYIN